MALLKVTLIAEDASNCSYYSLGEQTVIDYPHIVLDETDRACISAIEQCHPYLLPLSQGVAFATLGIGEETGSLRCYCPEGSVTFRVIKQPRRISITPYILKHLTQLRLEFTQLQSMPVFAPLPESYLEKIVPLLQLQQVLTGNDIIQQGDVGRFFYVITEGEVEVVRHGGQIREEVLANLSKGECFGEMSLISGEPISATIRAKTPVTLLAISKEDFDRLLMDNPCLHVYFTKLLTQRLLKANTRMMDMLDKGIMGSLKTFTIPELVQTLSLNRRTGTLIVLSKNDKAEIHFEKGFVHQVSVEDLLGEEAFYELLAWEEGQFQFQPAESVCVEREVHKDTMYLLMEGLRRLDEGTGLGK